MPEIQTKYLKKPLSYIEQILNYRGENSLYSNLRRSFLITNLEAGVYSTLSYSTVFGIEIHLTQAGANSL